MPTSIIIHSINFVTYKANLKVLEPVTMWLVTGMIQTVKHNDTC